MEKEKKVKCELCGFEELNLKMFKGRWLCKQCYMGEIENPEHQLEEK